MADAYLFGTYLNLNGINSLDFIADRAVAKWRSQVPVDETSVPFSAPRDWWYLTGAVHVVAISDLEYLLKTTETIADSYWLQQSDLIQFTSEYVGKSLVVTDIHFAVNYTPPTNPNPPAFTAPTPYPKPVVNLDYLSFAEERLELGYDYGAVGGPGFKTQITEVADDREQREITRLFPLGRWQLGDRTLGESESDKLAEVSYLKEFHAARLGSNQGFRFKDWSDYKGTAQLIGVGDGVKTDWQLRKAYKAGNAVCYRPIVKPVVGTVDIFVDGVNVAENPSHQWTVNHETGVLSNPTPLTAGQVLRANFEFDVPVWFESDDISITLEAYEPDTQRAIYRLNSVFIVEGKIPLAIPWEIEQLPTIAQGLDLGIVYETVEKYDFSTNKLALDSGFIRRESKIDNSNIFFDLGERIYARQELEKILGYFYCAKGRALDFPLINLQKTYNVRFEVDQLNIKFLASDRDESLYQINNLKLKAVFDRGFLNFLDFDTYLYILLDTSGSMNASIPTILQSIEELKVYLTANIYGTTEATDEKVIQVNFGDERWVNVYNQHYRDKAVYLVWINEASAIYHNSTVYSPPTQAFTDDVTAFVQTYNNRVKFRSIVYSIIFTGGSFDTFQNHLVAAFNGTDGYSPALRDYNIQLRLNVPEDTTSTQYYLDFNGTQLIGDPFV